MDKFNNKDFSFLLLSYSGGPRTSNSRIAYSGHNNLVLSLGTIAMAESTRSKTNMDRIEEAITKLASSHLHVTEKLDDLINRVVALETNAQHSPSPSSSSTIPTPQTPLVNPHRLKLDVPRFDGSDPSGWVFKITQFFEYHVILDPE